MKLCNEVITVFNHRINPEKGWNEYVGTVIRGVSWYSHMVSSVGEHGLNAADEVTVRIPEDADFGGKSYVTPKAYKDETIVSGVFTLANGDVIAKGAIEDTGLNPKAIKERSDESFTILSVTDNRRAPNAPHFRVVGS